jgi:hypothetical protein
MVSILWFCPASSPSSPWQHGHRTRIATMAPNITTTPINNEEPKTWNCSGSCSASTDVPTTSCRIVWNASDTATVKPNIIAMRVLSILHVCECAKAIGVSHTINAAWLISLIDIPKTHSGIREASHHLTKRVINNIAHVRYRQR